MYNALYDSPNHGIDLARENSKEVRAREKTARIRRWARSSCIKAGIPVTRNQLASFTDNQLMNIVREAQAVLDARAGNA